MDMGVPSKPSSEIQVVEHEKKYTTGRFSVSKQYWLTEKSVAESYS